MVDTTGDKEQMEGDFRKVLGKLSWTAQQIRPDIAGPTCDALSRATTEITEDTRYRINKIVRYVKKTSEHELLIPKINTHSTCLVGYTDATAASHKRKSHAGRIIFLNDEQSGKAIPLYWRSHLPRNGSTSSLHAEAHAAQETVDMAIQIQRLAELFFGHKFPIDIRCDCMSVVKSCYKTTSDIECKRAMPYIQAMRQGLRTAPTETGNLRRIVHVTSQDQLADTLTREKIDKGLTKLIQRGLLPPVQQSTQTQPSEKFELDRVRNWKDAMNPTTVWADLPKHYIEGDLVTVGRVIQIFTVGQMFDRTLDKG